MEDERIEAEDMGTQEETPVVEGEQVAETPDPMETIKQLESRLTEKDKFTGRLSNELGATRKMLEEQARKQAEMERYIQSMGNNGSPTLEDQISEIEKKIEDGDIPVVKGTRLISQLTAQMAGAEAFQKSQAMLEEERKRMWMDAQNEKYIQMEPDYPDFLQKWNAGEFDNIRGMHSYIGGDPVLAHQKWKRIEAESALKVERERGKETGLKEAKKLTQGTGEGSKVLPGTGRSASQVKPQPKTMQDARAAYIARHKESNGFSKY